MNNHTTSAFDFIADIHGHAEELKLLLHKLGYENSQGFYKHPEGRKVIFLGNFIDKGKKIRKTLHIIKAMCDNGSGEAILGSHEYNALCFWEMNKSKGGYLRKHSIKNIMQHSKTIKQFDGEEEEWESFLSWFMLLPLFIEKPTFRAIHACWDEKMIEAIKNELPEHRMSKVYLHRSAEKEYKEHRQIRTILKGREMVLPKPYFIQNGDDEKKHEAKIKWWVNPKEALYGEYLFNCPEELKDNPVTAGNISGEYFYQSETPVFFGHYVLNAPLKLQTPKVACLDYGVAKSGMLSAYRFNGEKELMAKNFVSVLKETEPAV